jgi:nucleoid-associated protein
MAEITHCIVHRLDKVQHERVATVVLREQESAVNPSMQRLVDHLQKQYGGRVGKGYGRFEEDVDEYPTQRYLRLYLDGQLDFVAMTHRLMQHLRYRAEVVAPATGGYVLMALLRQDNRQYLLVAMVTEVVGTAITQGLDVIDSTYLDLNQLRVAGRVDLDGWAEGAERYISFLKERGDIAGYFKLFLGCNDLVRAKEESTKLVRGLKDFVESQNLEQSQRDAFMDAAFSYLSGLGRDVPLDLEAMSNHLWPAAPGVLQAELADEALNLSDGFVPDLRIVRGLVKLEGKSQYWKLSFDRQGIRQGAVIFNPADNTITLRDIPEALLHDLQAENEE